MILLRGLRRSGESKPVPGGPNELIRLTRNFQASVLKLVGAKLLRMLAPLRAGLDTPGVGAIYMTQKVAAFVESHKSVI